MASSNYLTVKTHLSEFKNNSDKDTQSEASESGTSNSVTSAEDLQKLAVILGLNSAEDVFQERFRVDRRRLEGMLAENLEESQTAQAFFHRIMNETNTLINWPARLKIGARSKKDPHVRVAGRPDDVKLAREKIKQLLDTRSNRVTMKIDVSYTDHSHIIGKGGMTIKRVMEETGCHIHFPDSNRTSAVEKSNQVSIAGDMERVERARARVRTLTPLVFSFELPIVSAAQPLPDLASPYVQQIQDQYNVQVMLRNRPKLHANLLVVKGAQWEVPATMEATSLLMTYMCGPLASQTQVQMSLEISPMHHPVVVGRGSEQLKVIMKSTNTQIMFPDADDPNIPALRKSCVTITGQIKDVYAARQQLVGSLPLVVIFDVPLSAWRADGGTLATLMARHRVLLSARTKPKQGIASVVIKGIERAAGDIYEARRALLGGTEPAVTAEIPQSYIIPTAPSFSFNPFSPSHTMQGNCSPFQELYSPHGGEMYSPHGDLYPHGGDMYSPLGAGFPASPAVLTPPLFPWAAPSPQPRQQQFHYPNMQSPHYNAQPTWNPGPTMSGDTSTQPFSMHAGGRPTTLSQLLNSSSQASSGYQSNFTGSCVSLDTQNISGGEGSGVVSPSVSPISAAPTRSPLADNDRTTNELASLISDLPLSVRRAPGCEKKTLETLARLSPRDHLRELKAEAGKAMREPVGTGYRVPNNRWAGYYFSHTSPGPMDLKEQAETTPEKSWPAPPTRPQILETAATPPTPVPATPQPQTTPGNPQSPPARSCRQLYDLLKEVGLGKYVELFKKHELDMSTFASLNEADLTEIGVTAFGARRKMLLTIAELQKQAGSYKGPPAGEKLINSPQYNTAALTQNKW